MKSLITAILFSFSLLILTSCQEGGKVLTANEFQAKVSKAETAQLIDVRTIGEFETDHLKGALNMDVNEANFETEIEKLDKNKPVYVYCLSGGRSSTAASILKSKGFAKVYELGGGILAWSKAGLPLEVSAPKVQKSNGNSVEENFARSISNDTLTLVDFFAYWCGPCMKMKPSIERLEKELASDVEILSIDVDVQKNLAKNYKITAMPTMVLFKNNKEIHRVVGYHTEKQLRNLIASYK